MNKPLITIITINYNSADFVDVMLHGFKTLTKNAYKVLICDNGSTDKEVLKLAQVLRKYENTEVLFRMQSQAGSIGHAEALDLMIEKVDTPYFAIMDADCTFLAKHWDAEFLSLFNEKVKLVGTPRGSRANKNLIETFGEYPAPYAVLIDTKSYKELNISCMPGDVSLGQDTCWEWAKKYSEAGYEGKILESKNTRQYKEGPFSIITGCEEYYLQDSQEIVAAHFGRGSTSGEAKYLKGIYLPVIGEVIRKQVGKREKKQWIEIATKLIRDNM